MLQGNVPHPEERPGGPRLEGRTAAEVPAEAPRVFLDYTQAEPDAAYDQAAYQPNIQQLRDRWIGNSERTRGRIGLPSRHAYGPSEIERLDIFRTDAALPAPVFVFIHGGAWRAGSAKTYAAPAEMFIRAGAPYVVPDFLWVQDAGGSLLPIADQVRRAIVRAGADQHLGPRGVGLEIGRAHGRTPVTPE